MLKDAGLEGSVLAGVFKYGFEQFCDLDGIVTPNTFTDEVNQILWKCAAKIYLDPTAVVDYPSILNAAKELGCDRQLEGQTKYIGAVLARGVEKKNVGRFAAKLKKFEIARQGMYVAQNIQGDLSELVGDESVSNIVSKIETPIYEFINSLSCDKKDDTVLFHEGLSEYLDHIESNPVDIVGVSTGFHAYDKAIGGGLCGGGVYVIGARPKTGKALRHGSLVYTPNGPIKIEDCKIGDLVCTPDGQTSKIEGVFPQGITDIYRVYFGDKNFVDCTKEHLWEVKGYKRKVSEVLELQQFWDSLHTKIQDRWFISFTKPCYYNYKAVPIDPYFLGLLIGNGTFAGSTLGYSTNDNSTLEYIKEQIGESYKLRQSKSNKYDWFISKISKIGPQVNIYLDKLRNLGLSGKTSHFKFIPDIYKYNSIENRLAILQGLFDTDGSADTRGNVEYSTTSKRLALDVKEICNSLGFRCTIKPRQTSCFGRWFDSFRLFISTNDNSQLFRLERKKNRCGPRKKRDLRNAIKRVEYIGKFESTCIKIKDPRGLFLTNGHIVTHNSLIVDQISLHIAGDNQIPVLNLDTEMSLKKHWWRVLANMTGISINEIKTGQYAKDPQKKRKVRAAEQRLLSIPYSYHCVAGKNFDEILSIARRWVMRTVGKDENGNTKPCVLIYDYLKLMTREKGVKEYEALGDNLMRLHDFGVQYDIPCQTFVQLNREGIEEESTGVISGSDRIAHYCDSFCIFKKKSKEEQTEERGKKGNRKMVPIIARDGEEFSEGDYINYNVIGEVGRVEELTISAENAKPDPEEDMGGNNECPF